MKTRILFLLLSVSLLFSCSKDDDIVRSTVVQIRLSNNSDVDFENATFNGVDFGDMKAGETTDYKTFEKSYSYGSVAITIEGEEYGWIPIDFVGEELLATGNYSFEYNFDQATKVLSDQLIKD